MEKILILGAGRAVVGLIKAAKEAGYHTIVASIPGNYPGFEYADEIEYVNILDPDAVLEAAKRQAVGGVASCCFDLPMKSQGRVNDALGLCGISEKAAELSVNKHLMKTALLEAGATTPAYFQIHDESELAEAIEQLNMPVIIKAVDQNGSKGLNVVRDKSGLAAAFEASMSYTKLDYCIVEEFIEGEKIGCNAFVAGGELQYILPCGDITVNKGTVIPVGHYIPLELEPEVEAELEKEMRAGIRALGLDNCAVNADIMIKDGKVYIIEITGRQGANALPELCSVYLGVNVYRLIADTAMGKFSEELYPMLKSGKRTPCAAEMLLSEVEGVLERVPAEKQIELDVAVDVESEADEAAELSASGELPEYPEWVREMIMFSAVGDEVASFANTSDCIGELIVEGDSTEECIERLNEIKKRLDLEIR